MSARSVAHALGKDQEYLKLGSAVIRPPQAFASCSPGVGTTLGRRVLNWSTLSALEDRAASPQGCR